MLPDSKNLFPAPEEQKDSSREWLTPFLDMFMLLLAFFIILGATAANIETQTPFQSSEEGTTYRSHTDGPEPVITPIWELKADLQKELRYPLEQGHLQIKPQYNELRLEFTDGQFYETASANLLDGGQQIIDRIIYALSLLAFYEYHIDVEGHTDDRPIQTLRFPGNWELSTARAANIIRSFAEKGFPPERLKASGYAEMHPLAPNRDELGNPILENMALNRRIVIRIYYELGDF